MNDFPLKDIFHLEIKKGDTVRVISWDIPDKWVYGYKEENPQKRGLFPISVIKKEKQSLDKQIIFYDVDEWYRVRNTETKEQIGAFKYLDRALECAIDNSDSYGDFVIKIDNGQNLDYKEEYNCRKKNL